MSSNLTPSLPSGNHRSAAAHAVDALSGVSSTAALNARGQTESDSQAFARWMAQYSQSEPLRQAPATPAAALPQAAQAQTAVREPAKVPQKAPPLAPHATQVAMNAAKQTTQGAQAETAAKPQAQAQARPTAKAQPKPTTKGAEAASHDAKVDKADAADKPEEADRADKASSADSQGQPVVFTTAQGEATAYVKELQPPAHVMPGDPAAMLAWLSTLAQAQGHAQDPVAETGTGEASGRAALASGVPELGGDASGATSPLAWAVQGVTQDPASGGQDPGKEGAPSEDDRHGALSLAGLGMTEAQDTTALKDAASFGAFMSQALTRTPDGLTRQEATHHTDSLPTPPSSPEFAQALSDKVGMWVTGAALEGPMTAELRLNPAELGPVHIRIELDGQTAQVDFAAQALETRQAIEASLPMLSETLAQAGLSLSGGGVSDQPQQAWAQAQDQASGEQGQGRRASIGGGAGLNPQEPLGTPPASRLPRGRAGGLDLYA